MSVSEAIKDGHIREIVNVRRRQDRAAQTRERILDAATMEFAECGFGGATTRSIAERAQVQHGLLIYHFESKLGVWQAVMERLLNVMHAEFLETFDSLKDVDDVTKLQLMQRQFIWNAAAKPETNWLMSHEGADQSGRLSWLIERIVSQDIDVLIDLIAKVQSQGHYVDGDPTHLHYLYVGAASRVFMLTGEIERTMGQSPFDTAFIDSHIDLVESLFFKNLPAK